MKIKDLFLEELKREEAGTRKALERVPEGQNDWVPHEKSMKMGYLASLVATMLTGFCEGTFAGATKTTEAEAELLGGEHGLADVVQICPTLVLPFGTPFTDHETFASDDPVTVGVSVSCCDVAMLALVGEIETATPLTIAMDAEAETLPATA